MDWQTGTVDLHSHASSDRILDIAADWKHIRVRLLFFRCGPSERHALNKIVDEFACEMAKSSGGDGGA